MKIKNKLILVSLIPISLLGIISIIAVFWSNRLFSEFINEDVVKQSLVQGIDASEKDLSRSANLYLLIQNPKEKKSFDEDTNLINDYFMQYNKLPLSKEESEILSKVRLLINQGIVLKTEEFKIADDNVNNSNEFEDFMNMKVKPLLTEWQNKLMSQDAESISKKDLLQNLSLILDNSISESRAYSLFNKEINKKNTLNNFKIITGELKQLATFNLSKEEMVYYNQLQNNVNYIIDLIKKNLDITDMTLGILDKDETINGDLNTAYSNLKAITTQKKDSIVNEIGKIENVISTALILLFIFGVIFSLVFAEYLLRPVEYLISTITRIRKGENIEIKKRSDDELGDLTVAFGDLIHENKIHTDEINSQNWLKEHLSEILKLAHSQSSVEKMCQVVITKIAEIMDIGLGAFYILKTTDVKTSVLILLGSYAYKERKHVSNEFKLGEGLVGQCALEGKPIVLTDVPEDYIQIVSGLGSRKPTTIAVMPILLKGHVLGVIELASFHPFSEVQQQLLEQVSNSLGVVIDAIHNRLETEEALVQVQRQSEELQAQQEELRTSNEELEEKTHSLQESEEELKTQSEELQAANEELHEKMESIEQQKSEIEQKNRAVEEMNRSIEEKAQALARAGKYKTEFLSNMSHELRTPLNSLLLLSKSFANNDDGNLTKEQIEQANIIYRGGKDLLELINDILDLSKVEAGKLNIQLEETEISEIISDIKRQFESIATDKGIRFLVEIDTKVKNIYTDAHRLKQILRNLISNAIKFTQEGFVKLLITQPDAKTQLMDKSANIQHYIAFEVIDTGIGIAKAKQEDIFEAFQQAYGDTDRIYGGTGLGLTISRELSKLLRGEIQLHSELGKGSTFLLYIPVRQSEEVKKNDVVYESPQLVEKSNAATEKTILLIVNDSKLMKKLENIAIKHNYHPMLAESGKRGIELAKQLHPDGIILDLSLTDIDGILVHKELKDNPMTKKIPIHVIYNKESADILKKFNMGDIFEKPLRSKDFDKVFDQFDTASSTSVNQILLIEDDIYTQKAVQKEAAKRHINITSANTGKEALKLLQSNHFDGAILDLKLPDMDGLTILEKCSEQNITIPPIIVYSGKDLSEAEFVRLHRYTNMIVRKEGSESLDRLLNECSLFLHSVSKKRDPFSHDITNMLHDTAGILHNKTVLLVDDDMRNIYALSKVFQKSGMNVAVATNGQEALAKLSNGSLPDIVIMDIMMPIMDGYETMRKIRKQEKLKLLPIIAVTAKAMPDDKRVCLESGANDYITKPIDDEKLISLCRVWLSK